MTLEEHIKYALKRKTDSKHLRELLSQALQQMNTQLEVLMALATKQENSEIPLLQLIGDQIEQADHFDQQPVPVDQAIAVIKLARQHNQIHLADGLKELLIRKMEEL